MVRSERESSRESHNPRSRENVENKCTNKIDTPGSPVEWISLILHYFQCNPLYHSSLSAGAFLARSSCSPLSISRTLRIVERRERRLVLDKRQNHGQPSGFSQTPPLRQHTSTSRVHMSTMITTNRTIIAMRSAFKGNVDTSNDVRRRPEHTV